MNWKSRDGLHGESALITQCVGRQGDDSGLEPTILNVPYGLNYQSSKSLQKPIRTVICNS